MSAPATQSPVCDLFTTTNRPPADDIVQYIQRLDRKFERACDQIVLLNNEILDLQSRYDRAASEHQRSWRYYLRLRIATVEGIRDMYHKYATLRADELDELQGRLVEESILHESDVELESDMES